MPDKLTDSEIVKALECCIKEDCSNCSRDGYVGCLADNMHNALDTINRLQAENEKLKTAQFQFISDINSLKAENERLKKENENLRDSVVKKKFKDELFEMTLGKYKAEAYKEFYMKLKARFKDSQDIAIAMGSIYEGASFQAAEKHLDNLLKEMVGEDK